MKEDMEEVNNKNEMGWWRGWQEEVLRKEGWSQEGRGKQGRGTEGEMMDMYAETGKDSLVVCLLKHFQTKQNCFFQWLCRHTNVMPYCIKTEGDERET